MKRPSLRVLAVMAALGALSHGAWAQSATNGSFLYAALCDSCHGRIQLSAPVQRGVDAADIKNAVYGWVGVFPPDRTMAQFQGQISDSGYNDLAAFIAQQVGGGVVATCTSAGVPTASAMATPVVCPNTGGATTGTGGPTTGTTNAPVASPGGGGCTLGRSDQSTDPLWLLLLAGAAWVLRRRKPLG